MAEPIVEIRGLSFRYEGAEAPVLRDVHLTVEAGETVLLLGPSGCGKSTLLLCLNGIIPHRIPGEFSGQVTVAGLDVLQHEVHTMAEKVGLVFQDPEAQFAMLYVEDEVAFGLENLRYPREVIVERVEAALRQVGLAHKIGQRLDRLSGGEKQKVALASVLAMEPEVLAFDAPTANLDPLSAQEFFALLRHLKEALGKTLIIVEQQVDGLIPLVDRLVLMNGAGEIIADGAPREVIATVGPDALSRYGIWTPQVWELVDFARRQGMDVPEYPLTVEEAHALLAPVLDGRVPSEFVAEHPRMQAEGEAAIRVEGLSHTYPAYPADVVALRDVRLQIAAGDFCAIVGQNGAGKTTLAKFLTKILEPPPGSVFLNGEDVAALPLREVTRHIGYVFQNPEHQFVEDTVYDELAYSLRVRGIDEATVRERVLETLEAFQLRPLAHRHPFELSQGEKRRLSVATMLIVEPEVLILDEPTLGLDRATASALMEAMRALNARGKTVVFITHDMRLVAEYARSAVVMADGEVVFQGSVRELFQRPEVMDRAALLAPPMVALARRFREVDPTFPPLVSLQDFQRLLEVASHAIPAR